MSSLRPPPARWCSKRLAWKHSTGGSRRMDICFTARCRVLHLPAATDKSHLPRMQCVRPSTVLQGRPEFFQGGSNSRSGNLAFWSGQPLCHSTL